SPPFLLLGTLIALILSLIFVGCQKITQEEVSKQGGRWWVLYYKMTEPPFANYDKVNQLIEEVEKALCVEFNIEYKYEGIYPNCPVVIADYLNSPERSLRDLYNFTKRQNQLMEEVLVKIKGKEVLKEIEGKYSLEEAYGSLKEANRGRLTDEELELYYDEDGVLKVYFDEDGKLKE
ncbi:unnamed protein product, partial [marine sediment metagenome]